MNFIAVYSPLHRAWLVPDPWVGGLVYASGNSKDEAEFNAHTRYSRT